jgi:hypothetical protein
MVSVPYKQRLKLRKEADRAIRSLRDPDELRATLVEVAFSLVESLDQGYEDLFGDADGAAGTPKGIPQHMRKGRERIWLETCGKQRTLWRLVGERLLTVNVVPETEEERLATNERLATIWATALRQEKKYVI